MPDELLVMLTLLICSTGGSIVENPPTEYLSEEARPRLLFHTQGWGELGFNTCTHAPGVEPLPMRIRDRSYDKGLGTHAPSEILVDLSGQYLAFEAEIGVQPGDEAVLQAIVATFADLLDQPRARRV